MRPNYLGIDHRYYEMEVLENVANELRSKAHLWATGIDSPSLAEKFAYEVLANTAMWNFFEKGK